MMLNLSKFALMLVFMAHVQREHLFCAGQGCKQLDECKTLRWLHERKNEDNFQRLFKQFSCPEGNNNAVICPLIEADEGADVVLVGQNVTDAL